MMQARRYMNEVDVDGIIALNGALTMVGEKVVSKYNVSEENLL